MIRFLGILNRAGVNQLYGKSRIGILLYQPAKNHFESQPIKMFEYMAAGLPVVCSDFPLWKEIVEDNHCGITVDCTDSAAVKKAVEGIIHDDAGLAEMGRNGYRAVMDKYNWGKESIKLLNLYNDI